MLYGILNSFRIAILILLFTWIVTPSGNLKCRPTSGTHKLELSSGQINYEQVYLFKEDWRFVKRKLRSKATESSLPQFTNGIVNAYNYSNLTCLAVVQSHIFSVAESNRKRGPPRFIHV